MVTATVAGRRTLGRPRGRGIDDLEGERTVGQAVVDEPDRVTLDGQAGRVDDGHPASGVDLPAAVILEAVQGEGGLNVASSEWLRGLQALCTARKIVLIVDDIQAGCGRTGTFFSFEPIGIKPDIITMSKSLSGYGLPMAVVLMKPALDQWKPGEHNGTFRGNNMAFITATAAIDHYWTDDAFAKSIEQKGLTIANRLNQFAEKYGDGSFNVRGRGMFQGINCVSGELASDISLRAFREGLMIETSGAEDQVIKLLCPLTISDEALADGLLAWLAQRRRAA